MSLGDILDDLDEDEDMKDDKAVPEKSSTVFMDTEAAKFIYNFHGASRKAASKSKGHRSKHASAHGTVVDYYDVASMIRLEDYWSELQGSYDDLMDHFANNLTMRSTNSLDKLPINFEGDVYPLHELAQISKKDAKRLIIDCSSFPGLVSPVSKAISESNMNLRPQADGDRLFVPIPKVTREYREQLSKGAKASFLKAKEGFRRIQNNYISAAQNVAMSPECRVPKDKQHMVEEIIRSVANDFAHRAEEILKTKQEEIRVK
uniref:Ribosome-recycling factor, mitochondrial n=1 Tax=Caligus rogercresseyi TaxID=217165 RepID=C1BRN9_CALRO|nr:Ribosome recycling factor, mitochondrial precursor [Caligus rogercresseyi]